MEKKNNEHKVVAIIAVVVGGIALLTSWMPFINNGSAALALVALILGAISVIINRKNKKVLSLVSIIVAILAFIIVLITQSAYGAAIDSAMDNSSSADKTGNIVASKTKSSKEASFLEEINKLADSSVSTDELYITGKITVGESGDIKPGIYDLEITGGNGNIMGDRSKTYSGLYINWTGASTDSGGTTSPSVIRVILFEGDTLDFSNISKIKLTAVENVSQSNEIGIGNYVVGRDIPAGTYTLSTNMTMDTEFENLGWNIGIYNEESGDERSQSLNPGNMDVTVKLSEGEIITTSFYNTDDAVPADSAKLIFTPVSN